VTKTSIKRLEQVHPVLASRVYQMAEALMDNYSIQIEVVQGLRTFAEQDALYAKGRTAPGKIVTKAKGGESNHNYGLAVDVCPYVAGKPDWVAKDSVWSEIGDAAKAVGLAWGGDWKFVDKPHVELPGMSVKECQQHYQAGGIRAVWLAMDTLLATV
jgi:hypothetical protein